MKRQDKGDPYAAIDWGNLYINFFRFWPLLCRTGDLALCRQTNPTQKNAP